MSDDLNRELMEQVRILGNRVIALDQELDQTFAALKKGRVDNDLYLRLRDERNALVPQVAALKKELSGEKKRRTEAERLVAALQRELETTQNLLGRLQDEAELGAKIGKLEPLLEDVLAAFKASGR